MKVAIIDYGMGNIFSLQNALRKVGFESELVDQPELVVQASHVILPGVGAAELAAPRLRQRHLDEALATRTCQSKPTTGICLGMQLFATNSTEGGDISCLGLIDGSVTNIGDALPNGEAKVPSVGWYSTHFNDSLFSGDTAWLKNFQHQSFYYVHSYQFKPTHEVDKAAQYHYGGAEITGMVANGSNMAVQFHPEKSGEIGLEFLKSLIRQPR